MAYGLGLVIVLDFLGLALQEMHHRIRILKGTVYGLMVLNWIRVAKSPDLEFFLFFYLFPSRNGPCRHDLAYLSCNLDISMHFQPKFDFPSPLMLSN